MNVTKLLASSIAVLGLVSLPVQAEKLKVNITKDIASVTVKHNGKDVTIMRNQDNKNTVIPAFAKTSRNCPPFCINPIKLAPGVETLGEVEVLDYLKRMSDGDSSILVIDSRTPDWVMRGTIPGAVSVPWTKLNPAKGADPLSMTDIIVKQFGAKETDEEMVFDYSNANQLTEDHD
ncbi:MAG: rhodanese-like domain-containing protein [Gammaproteobacteria bacterium]|nr:rhodanese-like domain-containing protein [Gammaproteobacteria bacterium]